MERIRMMACECLTNERGSWCRVWTARANERWLVSELSLPLARRIVPLLLAKYGEDVPPGLFNGSAIVFRP